VYVDIDTTQEVFSKYYNSDMSRGIDYYSMFGVKETQEYYEHIFDSIKKYITFDSDIMDLGCGLGDFTKFLTERGYRNVLGVDPSERNIETARKKGINCIQADSFSDDPNLIGKFDFIIFSHTLEHIFDTFSALENVKRMLKPNGIIYIEVPDASKYCDVDFSPYFFLTYEHVVHYTYEILPKIAGCFGFDLIQSEQFLKAASYYVLYGLFKNGGQYQPVHYNDTTKLAIQQYLECCKNNLKIYIEKLEISQEKLILWGIGASTALLLTETFNKCNVIKLVDYNPSRQGLWFDIGKKKLMIEPPESITDHDATIFVLPVMYKDSIIKQIKSLGLTNKIVTFG
jgi:SAM-dependent methyltransferase